MNERIQELARQAGIHPVNFEPDADLAVPLTAFAELIVKETLQVARAGVEFGPSMEDAVYNYFGVE